MGVGQHCSSGLTPMNSGKCLGSNSSVCNAAISAGHENQTEHLSTLPTRYSLPLPSSCSKWIGNALAGHINMSFGGEKSKESGL